MKEYRISKYDPQFRVNGAYQKNEWTSISEIGKVFDDGVLTLAEYLRVENEYIQFCLNAMKAAGVTGLSVCAPEIYCEGLRLPKRVCACGKNAGQSWRVRVSSFTLDMTIISISEQMFQSRL